MYIGEEGKDAYQGINQKEYTRAEVQAIIDKQVDKCSEAYCDEESDYNYSDFTLDAIRNARIDLGEMK